MSRLATVIFATLLASEGTAAAAMTLTSPDVRPGAVIPVDLIYPRCGGRNISPALAWSGVPAGTRSLVLTMIDLDVKPAQWSHWLVVDLSPAATGLGRGAKALPGKAAAVVSNFGDAAYDGPCPPNGTGVHHYQFTIWAMPTASTAIAPDSPANQIAPRLAKSALAHASLTGWVKR